MLDGLKEAVLKANLDLRDSGLVLYTWGNVSAVDRRLGLVVIKPSGVGYGSMRAEDMVVVGLDGAVVEGALRPSSDLPTHLALYKAFPGIGGVAHTHSDWATAWAQAGRPIHALGTTHADYFRGDVPCTRALTEAEVGGDYEAETGKVIVEAVSALEGGAGMMPGALVSGHGPFTWGADAAEAVHNSVVLENVAMKAFISLSLNPSLRGLDGFLLNKHYLRKHGAGAYYGQQADG
ncbi:MAG: L-ribulose-5-phosphate 4-epimerase [Oscillospiraceae bacterium]|nr:L-ribulose-5-phosphate 4-epimerase [Oscillospiraceae bacterium]